MSEPTLVELFGAGAIQDIDEVVIQKSSLVGLTASADNTAESIVVGLLLTMLPVLTQENFNANLDQSIYIQEGLGRFLDRGTPAVRNRLRQLIFNLVAPDTEEVDPNVY